MLLVGAPVQMGVGVAGGRLKLLEVGVNASVGLQLSTLKVSA